MLRDATLSRLKAMSMGAINTERITAVALDVDGVLTDDHFTWNECGQESKSFAFIDVMGISSAKRAGIAFGLISGEDSILVERYAAKLGIAHVWKGCKDKRNAIIDFAKELSIGLESVAFIGNDINDLSAMEVAGIGVAPQDAHPVVLKAADYICCAKGGAGAVREFLDLLLQQQEPRRSNDGICHATKSQAGILQQITEHQQTVAVTFEKETEKLYEIIDQITSALERGNKLLLCGNGGSAAEAQHVAAELVGRFKTERTALAALSLNVDSAVMTCLANDFGYEELFARQVSALAQAGDVLLAISTSGRSTNIINALKAGWTRKTINIAFTGAKGRSCLSDLTDHIFCVHSSETDRIQEVHNLAFHLMVGAVELSLKHKREL